MSILRTSVTIDLEIDLEGYQLAYGSVEGDELDVLSEAREYAKDIALEGVEQRVAQLEWLKVAHLPESSLLK